MALFWATLQLAIGAGLATTFDDTIYLAAFFGKTNRNFRPTHVAVGELIGFTMLLMISLIGFLIGLAIPRQMIGLLGFLPMLIGIREISQRWRGDRRAEPMPEIVSSEQAGGFASDRRPLGRILADRQTYRVAMVTISNGANNLSIYIPLFASLSIVQILISIPVFYGFIGLWLFLSFHLSRTSGIALLLNRHAPTLFPWILIWLGWRILSDSGALSALNLRG